MERWIVSGDGTRYALGLDHADDSHGYVQRDATTGLLVFAPTEVRYTYAVGTADEIAWADATDGKAYRNADSTNAAFAGYEYVADGVTVSFGGKTYTAEGYTTVAKKLIAGDGSTHLVLYYQPLLNTLNFFKGDRANTTAGTVTTVKLYTDQTYTLPDDYKRDGYTLMGWTTKKTVAAGSATTTVSDLKGLASQAAWASVSTSTARTYQGGAEYTTVATFAANGTKHGTYTKATGTGARSFVMPSIRTDNSTNPLAMTLYAVWRAHDDTPYYVERWIVSGDGERYAVKADGRLDRDGQGILVSSPAADSAHRVQTHYGVTDEVAYADLASRNGVVVSYYNEDQRSVTLPGYTYLDQEGDADTWVAFGAFTAADAQARGWKTVDHAAISGNVDAAHITTLVLYFEPNLNTLTFVSGDDSTIAKKPVTVQLYSDQSLTAALAAGSYRLPADTTRTGYTLMGWTNAKDGKVTVDGTAVQTQNAKGITSQRATTAAQAGETTRDSAAGRTYTGVRTYKGTTGPDAFQYDKLDGLYTMPTTNAILYAVWRANDDTTYYVERWAINGDGQLFPLNNDGSVPYDGLGHVEIHDEAWAQGQHIEHHGISDEEAWANEATAGVSYHNADHLKADGNPIGGYTLIENGKSFEVGTNTYTQVARKDIDQDGTTLIRLYYTFKDNTFYVVNHWRVTGDQTFKDRIYETPTAKTDAQVIVVGEAADLASAALHILPYDFAPADGTRRQSDDFRGYRFVRSVVTVDGPRTSSTTGSVTGEVQLVIDLYYEAINDGSITLTLDAGDGTFATGDKTTTEAHAAESTFQLPTAGQMHRDGYDFIGWANVPDGAQGLTARGAQSIKTADRLDDYDDNFPGAGLKTRAEAAKDQEADQTTDQTGNAKAAFWAWIRRAPAAPGASQVNDQVAGHTYANPAVFFILPGGTFLMPTSSTRLFAVWRARDDVDYEVSHYLVDEEGVVHEVTADREHPQQGSDDTRTHHITDEDVSSEAKEPGYYPGYTYVPGATATTDQVLDEEGNPIASVDAEGKPVLDEDGKPVVDAEGKALVDADGNPYVQYVMHVFDKDGQKLGDFIFWAPADGGDLRAAKTPLTTANLDGDGTTHLRFFYTANRDTAYAVERWAITADGTLVPLNADGTVPRDDDGNLQVHDADWAQGQRIWHQGTTDEEAWADEDVEGVSYRNADNLEVQGYTYLPNGASYTVTTADGTQTVYVTRARLNIEGDGTTVLVLYYVFNKATLVLDPSKGLWTEGASQPEEDPTPKDDDHRLTPAEVQAKNDRARDQALTQAGGRLATTDGRRHTRSQDKGSDAQIVLPTAADVTRNGYVLAGWSDGTHVWVPGYTYTLPTGGVTLTAVWEPVTYTIVFDKNDPVAKGTTKPYTYVYGTQEALLPASGFTRRNARFLGWSFSKDATKPDFTDAQVMEALTEAKRKGLVVADATIDDPATAMFLLAAMAGKKTDLTLYAVWDVERHTATLTGGTRQTDPWGHTTSEGTWTGGRVRIDADAIEPGFTLPREAVTVEAIPGWYLKGWRITRDGVTYEVMDPEAIYSLTMDADTSFEPIWGNRAQEEAERRHRLGLDRTYGADQAADRIPQTADYLMDLGALSLSLAGLGVLVLLLALLVFSTQCDRLAPPASPGLPPNSSR